MSIGAISGRMLSVAEALDDVSLNNEVVAVHGILYCGELTHYSEFVLLAKDGPFDGDHEGTIQVQALDNAIGIRDPRIAQRFKSIPGACGSYLHKYDALIIGWISRATGYGLAAVMTDIWSVVLQDRFRLPSGKERSSFCIMDLSHGRVPVLPWAGRTEAGNLPLLEAEPVSEG